MVAAAMIGSTALTVAANASTNRSAAKANNAAADAAGRQAQLAQEQYGDWKSDFLPLQHDITADAKKAGSQYEYDRAAELANGDVTQAYGRAKTDLSARLASYGIDPSQGKYTTTFGKLGLAEAAAGAGAQNKARDTVTDKAWAKKIDAYSVGKGIPGTALAGLGSAAQTNAMVANNYSNQASRNAVGIGNFVQQGVNWWNSRPPAAGANVPGPTNDGTWT